MEFNNALKFLDTSRGNYFLGENIKNASDECKSHLYKMGKDVCTKKGELAKKVVSLLRRDEPLFAGCRNLLTSQMSGLVDQSDSQVIAAYQSSRFDDKLAEWCSKEQFDQNGHYNVTQFARHLLRECRDSYWARMRAELTPKSHFTLIGSNSFSSDVNTSLIPESEGLSTGAIVGIASGVGLFLLLIAVLLTYFLTKRCRN